MNCLTTAWTTHEPELRGWLRRRLANPAQADDLLQDLFFKALRQGDCFHGPGRQRLARSVPNAQPGC